MSGTKIIEQCKAPDSTGSGVDLPRIVSLLRHGTEEEHRATLKRAKENGVSYVWSGDLRNSYLLENLRFGQDAGLIEVKFVEYYEAQESGYYIKYLEANDQEQP